MFCQLFAEFRLNPCEFYHIKNRLSTSNSMGLKSFAGTTILSYQNRKYSSANPGISGWRTLATGDNLPTFSCPHPWKNRRFDSPGNPYLPTLALILDWDGILGESSQCSKILAG
jgi:hypothetical protein